MVCLRLDTMKNLRFSHFVEPATMPQAPLTIHSALQNKLAEGGRDHTMCLLRPSNLKSRGSQNTRPTLVGLGMPIPVKPPTSREKEKLSKKKTRRHNQLGLNPRTVKRESSEGDNGVDEEVKLAVVASLPTAEP